MKRYFFYARLTKWTSNTRLPRRSLRPFWKKLFLSPCSITWEWKHKAVKVRTARMRIATIVRKSPREKKTNIKKVTND
jgi:hypothetical protein